MTSMKLRRRPNEGRTATVRQLRYRVRYRSIWGGRKDIVPPILVGLLTIAVEAFFVTWLLQSHHFPALDKGPWNSAAELFVVVSIAIMELMRLVQVVSLSLASVLASDPEPAPDTNRWRVAFITTIVPAREPIGLVRRTLEAAKRIRCDDLDVWLLDEGDDATVKATCNSLGVRHFSRRGQAAYNTAKGRFAAASKHGNINSWLDAHSHKYDIVLCVDPDHIPKPEYAELVLGYFNDRDVAFVVGPQFYANVGSFVSRGAESQQFPFHSVIQRAGNTYRSPMLVGTNNAIRISALMAAGGFADSITEDMATGIMIQTLKNPTTGRRWESVYVPDVLAIGEGPSSWNDYFSQQVRWSRGSFQVIGRTFLRRFAKLPMRARLNYLLITSFYPTMAIGWLLGALNAVLFVVANARGITVPVEVWTVLYADATASQLWVYLRARRHNVSPFDTARSGALVGTAMTMLAAPLYAAAMISALTFRRGRFVVTPKGSSASGDSWRTFYRQLYWVGFYTVLLAVAFVIGHSPFVVLLWPMIALVIALMPMFLWRHEIRQRSRAMLSEELTDLTEAPLLEQTAQLAGEAS